MIKVLSALVGLCLASACNAAPPPTQYVPPPRPATLLPGCLMPDFKILDAPNPASIQVALRVSPEGQATQPVVKQSTGSSLVDAAIVKALVECPFVPAKQEGVSIESSYDFKKTFTPLSFRGALRCLQEDYPEISRRLGEAGQATISFRITQDGAPELQLNQSTGFVRLDEASDTFIRRCISHRDVAVGLTTGQWYTLRVSWRLPSQ